MSELTRRGFVKAGIGTFAALAADGVLGVAEEKYFTDEVLRKRFAAIGFAAYDLARADDAAGRKPPAFPLKAVWAGAETDRGKALLRKVGDIPGFTVVDKYEAADAVVCTAEPARHAEIAIAALKAGKSVFVDPPVALTDADCAAVEEATAASKGIYFYGDRYAASTCYRPGIAAVRAGAIGEVREARVGDFGIPHHHVQTLFALESLGVAGEPTKVEKKLDAKGDGDLRLVWADGKTLTLSVTHNAVERKTYCSARVMGTKGAMTFNADDRSLQFDASGVLTRYWWGRDPERTAIAGSLPVPWRDLDTRQLAHFAVCVNNRAFLPYVSLADALSFRERFQMYFS